MRKLILLLCTAAPVTVTAQNNLTSNIIEGGKTLVDLIRVIKTPKLNVPVPAAGVSVSDSCAIKAQADICYKNTSGKTMQVSLFKRSGNTYAAVPLSLKILNGSQECLYELQAGIYKYKMEYEEEDGKKTVYKEGEIKLQACDKISKEIKQGGL